MVGWGVGLRLPRLYPIVDVGTLAARGGALEEVVRELVGGGGVSLQLRDRAGEAAEVLRRAEVISRVVEGTECLAVMNDRVDLALLAGWGAVHLGHRDLPVEAARVVFGGRSLVVGVSTHNDEQVVAAEGGSADYVAVGPVFGTGTKADAEPVVGLEGVRRARALTRKSLVAIGGITRGNAAAVVEAGADAVAVIGGLFVEGMSLGAVLRDFFGRLG